MDGLINWSHQSNKMTLSTAQNVCRGIRDTQVCERSSLLASTATRSGTPPFTVITVEEVVGGRVQEPLQVLTGSTDVDAAAHKTPKHQGEHEHVHKYGSDRLFFPEGAASRDSGLGCERPQAQRSR